MGLIDKLKKIDSLRMQVKRGKNYREFLSDAKDFSDNYEEISEKKGDYRYRLLLFIHNLEKGMCRANPRPFGHDKAQRIIDILKMADAEKQNLFEYRLAKSVLVAWMNFYDEKGWQLDETMRSFITGLGSPDLTAGRERMKAPKEALERGGFSDILFSRRSVRNFEAKPLLQEDIDFALDCFIAAPTACNRQMCKVYQIDSAEKKKLLCDTIIGIGGFNLDAVTLFLVTYDVGAFEYSGERNQGYVNVGLTAMNFANGLHARGIGSCFMQWSNTQSEDKTIRKTLGIPDRERIGIVLGAGYYKDEVFIPCSTRKSKKEIYKVL